MSATLKIRVSESNAAKEDEEKMATYYVNDNAQSNGDHEVHVSSCVWIPFITSKTRLGDYASCGPAVAKAKTIYPRSNGCATCSLACHTS